MWLLYYLKSHMWFPLNITGQLCLDPSRAKFQGRSWLWTRQRGMADLKMFGSELLRKSVLEDYQKTT